MSTTRELYKDFLKYAVDKGLDLKEIEDDYFSEDTLRQESDNVLEFEAAMYGFLNVQSVDDDPRLYDLLAAPGSYGINDPSNFRDKE